MKECVRVLYKYYKKIEISFGFILLKISDFKVAVLVIEENETTLFSTVHMMTNEQNLSIFPTMWVNDDKGKEPTARSKSAWSSCWYDCHDFWKAIYIFEQQMLPAQPQWIQCNQKLNNLV